MLWLQLRKFSLWTIPWNYLKPYIYVVFRESKISELITWTRTTREWVIKLNHCGGSPTKGLKPRGYSLKNGTTWDNSSHQIINSSHRTINSSHQIINLLHQIINSSHQIINLSHQIINSLHQIIYSSHQITNSSPKITISLDKIINESH